MKRVYRHYLECEEFAPNGMWRIVSGREERDRFVMVAARLMREPLRFEEAMLRAVAEWPNSCEANMTAQGMNHRAWFGHAGCFLATRSPEDCTRLGWHTLTIDEQEEANRRADNAIEAWELSYRGTGTPGQGVLFDA